MPLIPPPVRSEPAGQLSLAHTIRERKKTNSSRISGHIASAKRLHPGRYGGLFIHRSKSTCERERHWMDGTEESGPNATKRLFFVSVVVAAEQKQITVVRSAEVAAVEYHTLR